LYGIRVLNHSVFVLSPSYSEPGLLREGRSFHRTPKCCGEEWPPDDEIIMMEGVYIVLMAARKE
jgi:hypothetical protein